MTVRRPHWRLSFSLLFSRSNCSRHAAAHSVGTAAYLPASRRTAGPAMRGETLHLVLATVKIGGGDSRVGFPAAWTT
jgi:hypothetical protein